MATRELAPTWSKCCPTDMADTLKGSSPPTSVPGRCNGTGDFNGDGTSDLLWRNATTGDIEIWFMKNGQPSFFYDAPLPKGYTIDAVGDFHHDGSADLLMHDTSGNYYTWNFVNGKPDFAKFRQPRSDRQIRLVRCRYRMTRCRCLVPADR